MAHALMLPLLALVMATSRHVAEAIASRHSMGESVRTDPILHN
jgi:hypothetical protein